MMDGGYNSGFSYAYPTLDNMAQGQYGAQQQQPTGAYQFGGGFTPMVSDMNQGTGSTYQPAPSYTTYNMPTTNNSTSNYTPTFGGYSYSSTMQMPQMPQQQQQQYAPQQQPPQQRPQPTTVWTDPQGRPINFSNGQWSTTSYNPGGGGNAYTNYQYQGLTAPFNPLFSNLMGR